jgi:hypothetical protein
MAKRSGETVPGSESGEAGEGQTRAAIAVVIAGHSALKTRVNALMPRQSILFAKKFSRRRWTRGSTGSPPTMSAGCPVPRVTKELREREMPLTRRPPQHAGRA